MDFWETSTECFGLAPRICTEQHHNVRWKYCTKKLICLIHRTHLESTAGDKSYSYFWFWNITSWFQLRKHCQARTFRREQMNASAEQFLASRSWQPFCVSCRHRQKTDRWRSMIPFCLIQTAFAKLTWQITLFLKKEAKAREQTLREKKWSAAMQWRCRNRRSATQSTQV